MEPAKNQGHAAQTVGTIKFSPEMLRLVLEGKKTMTRRTITQPSGRYDPGIYAIIDTHPLRYVQVIRVRAERLRDITLVDLWLEGFKRPFMAESHYAFKEAWASFYPQPHLAAWENNPAVWVIEFELLPIQ